MDINFDVFLSEAGRDLVEMEEILQTTVHRTFFHLIYYIPSACFEYLFKKWETINNEEVKRVKC